MKIGQKVKTVGGWDAVVVWVQTHLESGFYAVHKPNTHNESVPIYHHEDGKVGIIFAINEAPSYNGHPADIVFENDSLLLRD